MSPGLILTKSYRVPNSVYFDIYAMIENRDNLDFRFTSTNTAWKKQAIQWHKPFFSHADRRLRFLFRYDSLCKEKICLFIVTWIFVNKIFFKLKKKKWFCGMKNCCSMLWYCFSCAWKIEIWGDVHTTKINTSTSTTPENLMILQYTVYIYFTYTYTDPSHRQQEDSPPSHSYFSMVSATVKLIYLYNEQRYRFKISG